MLHARAVLDRVAHVLQFENKTIKAVGGYNGLFHILANHAAYGGLAGLTAYPLGVGFPLAVCFDDGQAVLAAKFVGDFFGYLYNRHQSHYGTFSHPYRTQNLQLCDCVNALYQDEC